MSRTATTSRLADDEAHVWYLPTDALDARCVAQCARVLGSEEAARRDRFVFERDQRLYQIAHALLRTVLSNYADVAPREWRFRTNRYGRPEIEGPGPPRLRFNLSHTHDMAVVAVARGREIGVDVENERRRAATVSVAEHFFAPREVQALRREPPHRQPEVFFEFWTLKEAYIKARGMGLSLPLEQFSFCLGGEEDDAIRVRFEPELRDDPNSWQFAQRRIADHYRVAVAVRKEAPAERVQIVWRAAELKRWLAAAAAGE